MLGEATFWICSGLTAFALMAAIEAVYSVLKGDE